MEYWIITDTHFGHQKLIEAAGRPVGFEEKILDNIYKFVKQDDVLIHLGDICIGDDQKWNSAFTTTCLGKHCLVLGNHDHRSRSWYLSHGWDMVCDVLFLHVYGKKIAFSHEPLEESSLYDINFHGHHHNTRHHPEDRVSEKHHLLYIEHHYQPFKLKTLMTRKSIK